MLSERARLSAARDDGSCREFSRSDWVRSITLSRLRGVARMPCGSGDGSSSGAVTSANHASCCEVLDEPDALLEFESERRCRLAARSSGVADPMRTDMRSTRSFSSLRKKSNCRWRIASTLLASSDGSTPEASE